MKKITFLLCMLWFCVQSSFAQQPKSNTIGTSGDCPIGMCPTVFFDIEVFNLHKPRTNCTAGFGLCVRINVGVECRSCFGKSSINGTRVNAWVKINNQTAELHLPNAIKSQKGFENVNFSQFELEDQALVFTMLNGSKRSVRGGTYTTSMVGDEFVITLPLL